MVQIVQNIGQDFRVCGPLTQANGLTNPSFEGLTGGVPTGWQAIGHASLVSATDKVKFGTKSCRVNIASGSAANSGISQVVTNKIVATSYAFGAWIYIPTTATATLDLELDYVDINGTFMFSHTNTLTLGSATNDWKFVSYIDPVVNNWWQCTVSVQITASAATAFYIDGAIWAGGDNGVPAYVDGDMAGYVWENGINTTTLTSSAPDALRFFADGSGAPHPVPVII